MEQPFAFSLQSDRGIQLCFSLICNNDERSGKADFPNADIVFASFVSGRSSTRMMPIRAGTTAKSQSSRPAGATIMLHQLPKPSR